VYLTESDLASIARFLRMTPADFESRFVYRTRHRLRLRTPRDKQCRFNVGNACAIHPVKPAQCRLFPFWPELLESRREWKATAKWCPGIGQGPLIQIGTAHEVASEMGRAYPAQYQRSQAPVPVAEACHK
jgi:hypothetical protein